MNTTMTTLVPCEELSKSQNIRLADVFVIGPLMIFGGLQLKRNPSTLIQLTGLALMGVGVATIVFNGANYLKNQ